MGTTTALQQNVFIHLQNYKTSLISWVSQADRLTQWQIQAVQKMVQHLTVDREQCVLDNAGHTEMGTDMQHDNICHEYFIIFPLSGSMNVTKSSIKSMCINGWLPLSSTIWMTTQNHVLTHSVFQVLTYEHTTLFPFTITCSHCCHSSCLLSVCHAHGHTITCVWLYLQAVSQKGCICKALIFSFFFNSFLCLIHTQAKADRFKASSKFTYTLHTGCDWML
jgi:hypothetical protein